MYQLASDEERSAPSAVLPAWLALVTGAGILLFWVLFFTVGLAPAEPPPGYWSFEYAFVLPDLVLAAGLLAAGRALHGGRAAGPSLALVSAGGLLFLGLADLSFNLRAGTFSAFSPAAFGNGVMNAWCVLLGAWLARRFSAR